MVIYQSVSALSHLSVFPHSAFSFVWEGDDREADSLASCNLGRQKTLITLCRLENATFFISKLFFWWHKPCRITIIQSVLPKMCPWQHVQFVGSCTEIDTASPWLLLLSGVTTVKSRPLRAYLFINIPIMMGRHWDLCGGKPWTNTDRGHHII